MKSSSNSIPSLVSVKSLQPFLNFIEIKTGQLSVFERKIGHTTEFLSNPGSHVTHEEWVYIIKAAIEFLKDPMTAIHAVDISPLWWPEALIYIFRTSENLKDGFNKVFVYRKLFHSGGDALIEVTKQEIKLILDKNPNQNELFFENDFIAATWLKAARQGMYNPQLRPLRVSMTYEKPDYWKKLEAYFQAPVLFSSKRFEIHFSVEDTERPFPERDALLASLISDHIQSILKSYSIVPEFLNQIEHLVAENIKDPDLSAAKIAAKIPMSERSFYRKLSQENISFQKIHDTARCSLAKKYLTESNKLFAEISFLIGFAEVSSFSRSFKRWTGESPSEYRQRHKSSTKSPSL